MPTSGPPTSPVPAAPPDAAWPQPARAPDQTHTLPWQAGQPWQTEQPWHTGQSGDVGPSAQKNRPWLLISAIVTAAVLVFCGGVGVTGYLMYANAVGKGVSSPAEAVTRFLRAALIDHDARAAGQLVCTAARDHTALTNKIQEFRDFDQKYPAPTYTWLEPTEVSRAGTTARVITTRPTTAPAAVSARGRASWAAHRPSTACASRRRSGARSHKR